MNKTKMMLVVLFLMTNIVCFAEETTPAFDENVEDVPASPINEWIYGALLVASCYAGVVITNGTKKSINK
jgi:hypothetical protein|nr:hypothetical protein [uncultured Flavobacterium sp.]